MSDARTNADVLHFLNVSPSDEERGMAAIGTVQGVAVVHAAPIMGAGTGTLRLGTDGQSLTWQAPGSANQGAPVDVSAGGEFICEDGDDTDHYVRVLVSAPDLPGGSDTVQVTTQDVFGNLISMGDVDAFDALAGVVEVSDQMALSNMSSDDATNVLLWIDPAASAGIEISTTPGGPWVSPTTEGAALNLGTAQGGGPPTGNAPFYVRRTIAAAAPSDPDVLVHMHYKFTWNASDYYGDLRGLYRVFNAAEYRFYRTLGAPPAETDTPFDTAPSLPHTPPDLFTDGTWYVSMSYFNGVLDSGFLSLGPNGETYRTLEIAGGVEERQAPAAPFDVRLIQRANGVMEVQALYFELDPTGDPTPPPVRATDWAITYTTDATDPGTPPAVPPTVTLATIPRTGVAVLQYELPSQLDGTEVRVRVQVRRSDDDGVTWRYSDSEVVIGFADAAAPTPPLHVERWIGEAES